MFKQFVKDSAIYGISIFLGRVVIFLLLPLYARLLSPEDFGIVDILTTFGNFVNVLVALEISQALVRFYPEIKDDRREKILFASTSFWFSVIAFTLFLIVGLLFSRQLSFLLLFTAQSQTIFIVSLFSVWFYGIFYLTQNQLRVELESKKYAVSNIVMNLISVISTIVFVAVLKWGALGMVIGQAIGNLSGCVLSIYFVRYRYAFTFSRVRLMEMLKFSLPLVVSSAGSFGILYANRYILGKVLTLTDVGLLGVAYRVIAPVNLVIFSIHSALDPLIFTEYTKPDMPREISRIFRLFVAVSILIFVVLSLFSAEILSIMTTPEYSGAGAAVPFLVAAVFIGGMNSFAPGLYIKRKTALVGFVNLLAGIFTVFLSYRLILLIGFTGAAIATLVGNAFVFLIFMIYNQRLYPVPYPFGRIGIVGLLATAVVVASNLLLEPGWKIDLFYKFIMLLLVGVSIFCFNLIDFRKVLFLIKKALKEASERLGETNYTQ